jgi:hypothetical protein
VTTREDIRATLLARNHAEIPRARDVLNSVYNMSTNQSFDHVSLADLQTIAGGQGPAFPAGEVGTALGQGINETVKQWPNIKNTFNDAHRWGHENGWKAINAVRDWGSNAFSGNSGQTSGMSVPTGVP